MSPEEAARRTPANPLLRACKIILPDEKTRSAAWFIVSYTALVAVIGAVMSHLAAAIV